MGELIVPRLYRIVKIDKDTNTTVEEEIEISGRKVPLLCIRQNLQKKFLDAGIVRYATLFLRMDEVSRVVTEEAKNWIVDLFDKKRITMIGKSGMRNLDGTSEIKIVGKKKRY